MRMSMSHWVEAVSIEQSPILSIPRGTYNFSLKGTLLEGPQPPISNFYN